MAILEALAVSSSQAPTLSALARTVGLNPATCLGIVTELTGRGYVVRDEINLTYRLGPALGPLGRAAERIEPGMPALRSELARLWAELGFPCTGGSVIGGDIVVLHEVSPPGDNQAVPIGSRFTFRAPSGLMYALWHADAAVESWIERSLVDLPTSQVERIWDVIRLGRRSGYLVRLLSDNEVSIQAQLLLAANSADQMRFLPLLIEALSGLPAREYLTHPNGSAPYAVSWVAAPAYNAEAMPQYILQIRINRSDVTEESLTNVISHLLRASRTVTSALGGVDPREDEAISSIFWGGPIGPG